MRRLITLIVLSAAASSGWAQWLELSGTMIAQQYKTFIDPEPGDFQGVCGDRFGVTATILFDTTAPPNAADDNYQYYIMPEFRVDVLALSSPGEPRVTLTPDNAYGVITYSHRDDTIRFGVTDTDRFFELLIERPAGPFSFAMTSLPDEPEDYEFDGGSTNVVSAAFTRDSTGESVETAYSPAERYERGETVAYMVRPASAPGPEPCSEADLALPYGVLNFSDVLAFLGAFGAGCP